MAADAALATRIGRDLLREGLVVQDEFLTRRRIDALIRCAEKRRERGEFKPAQVGSGEQRRLRGDIRGDTTCWMAEPLFEVERALAADLEQLRQDLNREGYLGLFDLEVHYAHYPAGAGYARHVDQPQGRGQRCVSIIVYLNPSWKPGLGGALRLFDARRHRDIEPIGGRLVCFMTEGREHSVLTTACDRWSISGWFRTRA